MAVDLPLSPHRDAGRAARSDVPTKLPSRAFRHENFGKNPKPHGPEVRQPEEAPLRTVVPNAREFARNPITDCGQNKRGRPGRAVRLAGVRNTVAASQMKGAAQQHCPRRADVGMIPLMQCRRDAPWRDQRLDKQFAKFKNYLAAQ